MKNIEVGDIVTLKSGSPKMTVAAVDGGYTKSMHFDSATNKIVLLDLPVSALKIADVDNDYPRVLSKDMLADIDEAIEQETIDRLYKFIKCSIRWDLGELPYDEFIEDIKVYFDIKIRKPII